MTYIRGSYNLFKDSEFQFLHYIHAVMCFNKKLTFWHTFSFYRNLIVSLNIVVYFFVFIVPVIITLFKHPFIYIYGSDEN